MFDQHRTGHMKCRRAYSADQQKNDQKRKCWCQPQKAHANRRHHRGQDDEILHANAVGQKSDKRVQELRNFPRDVQKRDHRKGQPKLRDQQGQQGSQERGENIVGKMGQRYGGHFAGLEPLRVGMRHDCLL